MGESAAECTKGGLWSFAHFNRTYVVQLCDNSVVEINDGIEVLDAALDIADRYCAGA